MDRLKIALHVVFVGYILVYSCSLVSQELYRNMYHIARFRVDASVRADECCYQCIHTPHFRFAATEHKGYFGPMGTVERCCKLCHHIHTYDLIDDRRVNQIDLGTMWRYFYVAYIDNFFVY
jgi:hypothetical protein